MVCESARRWLPLLTDEELAPWRRWRLAAHLRGCPDCAAREEELRAMSDGLRERLAYHTAPPGLAARIGSGLAREARPAPVAARRHWRWPGLSMASGALTGALAAALVMLLIQAPGQRPELDALIDGQVRSLMPDHLTDVVTSDQHTVKPWLSAHADISPPVPDLAAQGFPLVGGRLDYIDGHEAAVVVYRRAKHVINLFATAAPDSGNTPMRSASSRGFNVVTWREDGIEYHAVSDVEMPQLQAFARDVRVRS